MISRRSFATGLLTALAAPAIIRTPGLLMPVKRLRDTQDFDIDMMTIRAYETHAADALAYLAAGMARPPWRMSYHEALGARFAAMDIPAWRGHYRLAT